ncbi:XdhC family protein [Angustibacter luteus]|uniref:XdhC family protein n=1 Tax=Angustibacter luteus TaxID=658456 RepID=A0ABW1JBG2_9ACTN
MSARVAELTSARVPFVHATVVRAQEPTSARPGDDAVVHADGTIEGFVGGHCAQGSVRTAALQALADGDPVLLRVLPDDAEHFPDSPSARVVVNPCLSGGALEIFLEPQLPAPLVCVVGDTPITTALLALTAQLGFVGRTAPTGASTTSTPGATAVVVASHGSGEVEAIRSALDGGVPFIGLVASRRRGAAVLDEMGLSDAERARVRTPVGLDIGARTAEEIALSILADVVRAVRVDGVGAADPIPAPVADVAIDPVCGMTVVVGADAIHLHDGDGDHYFCATGCRDRYSAQVRP